MIQTYNNFRPTCIIILFVYFCTYNSFKTLSVIGVEGGSFNADTQKIWGEVTVPRSLEYEQANRGPTAFGEACSG